MLSTMSVNGNIRRAELLAEFLSVGAFMLAEAEPEYGCDGDVKAGVETALHVHLQDKIEIESWLPGHTEYSNRVIREVEGRAAIDHALDVLFADHRSN